jgi:hypothetical protein
LKNQVEIASKDLDKKSGADQQNGKFIELEKAKNVELAKQIETLNNGKSN